MNNIQLANLAEHLQCQADAGLLKCPNCKEKIEENELIVEGKEIHEDIFRAVFGHWYCLNQNLA